MGKGSKVIKDFNKKFEPNCNNSVCICSLINQSQINKEGKKHSIIFLVIYSTISFFILYDGIEGTTKSILSTSIMFSVPILYELVNMRINDNKLLNGLLQIQRITFGIVAIASIIGLLTENNLVINEGLLVINTLDLGISISMDRIFLVILIVTISIFSNICGAESPLDENIYNNYINMSMNINNVS